MLEALAAEIKKSLGDKGAGVIAIPGLVKIERRFLPGRQQGRSEPVHAGRPDLFLAAAERLPAIGLTSPGRPLRLYRACQGEESFR